MKYQIESESSSVTDQAADSDARLILRVVDGDQQALADLFILYRLPLFHYLLQFTTDHGLAEELLQDVFVVVWRNAGSFEGKSPVKAWLFGIAHRRACKTKFGGVALPFTPPFRSYCITYHLVAIALTDLAAIRFFRYTTFSFLPFRVYRSPTVKIHIRACEQICDIIPLMRMFRRNDKVYVKLGVNQVAAIVLEVSPSSGGQPDLVWLKVAVRNPYFANQWIVTDYPEPVWSTALTMRTSPVQIPGLDK